MGGIPNLVQALFHLLLAFLLICRNFRIIKSEISHNDFFWFLNISMCLLILV